MKKTMMTQFLIASVISIFFFWGCGTDSSPVSPVSGDGGSYTVSVSVSPSTAYRTAGTANLWTETVVTEFHSTFTAEHQDDGHVDDHSDDDHGEETHHGEIFIGTTTIDDMMIVLTADHAADMFHVHNGHSEDNGHAALEFEEEHATEGDFLLEIHLYEAHHDNDDDHNDADAHGGMLIGYSDIHIATHDKDENEIEIPLFPVLTEHGFRYASNAVLAPGSYDLHVESDAPEFSRMSGFEQKWNDHIETEFHDFSFDAPPEDEIEIGSSEVSGLHFTLEADKVGSYIDPQAGELSLQGNETIQFLLKVEDETIQAEENNIYYSTITVHIKNDDSGETVEKVLYPVYGQHGFHYAVNISLPEGHGQDDTTDDHSDDEEEPHGH